MKNPAVINNVGVNCFGLKFLSRISLICVFVCQLDTERM